MATEFEFLGRDGTEQLVATVKNLIKNAGCDWSAPEGQPGHVLNRTHYESIETVNEPLNITWDGNTEGLVSSSDGWLYKISDAVLNDEQIKSVTVTSKDGSILHLSDIWDGLLVTEDVVASEVFAFCRKDGALDGYCTYPEAGIYTVAGTGINYLTSLTTTEPVEHTKTVVHKLDKKFLPDDAGGGIDVIAEVGQTIVVKTVDETGKPTEWEAVDLPDASTLTDRTTGKTYTLYVDNGKLHMEEAT